MLGLHPNNLWRTFSSKEGDERIEAVNTTEDLNPGLYRYLVLSLSRHWSQAKS